MSKQDDGWLTDDLDRQRATNRHAHAELFAVVLEANRSAQSVLQSFNVLSLTPKNIIVGAYYIRTLDNLQGAVLLAERGLMTEAYTLVRSGLETVFYLGAALREKDFNKVLGADHVKRMKKAVTDHLDWMDTVDTGDVDGSRLKAGMDTMLAQGIEPSPLLIRSVAVKAGMEDLYKTVYQQLSMFYAHPSMAGLNTIIDLDTDETPIGLKVGLDRYEGTEIVDVLSLAYVVYSKLLEEWQRYQPDPKRHERMERVGELFASYCQKRTAPGKATG